MKYVLLALVMVLVPGMAYANTETVESTTDTSDLASVGYDTQNEFQAQEFITTNGGTISTVDVCFRKIGTPTDDFYVAIEADSGGEPAGPDLALATINATSVSGAAARYTLTFASSYDLAEASSYWLVFSRAGALNGANNLAVCGSSTNVYAGAFMHYDTGTWISNTGDVNFEYTSTYTPSDVGGATSTVEQSQANLANAVYIFLAAMFGMVWFMRKH